MEKKKKISSKLKLIIILTFAIVVLSAGIVSAVVHRYPMSDHHDGAIVWGPTKGEIFKQFWDDPNNYNWDNLPTWLFAEWNISLWCAQKGGWIGGKSQLVTEEHYWAYVSKEGDPQYETHTVPYDENNPFKWYRRSETMGLVTDHHDWEFNKYEKELKDASYCGKYTAEYDEDDQPIIDSLEAGAPGRAYPKENAHSIEWYYNRDLIEKDYQHLRYILTARPIYDNADDVPRDPEPINKEDGEFDVKEKQGAIWRIPEFSGNIVNESELPDDRNLGHIALEYQKFYEAIHNATGEDRYEDIIKPYNAWKDRDEMKETSDDIEESTIKLPDEDKELKDYIYKDTGVEVDAWTGAYLLGPYCIDYSVNDEEKDRYGAPTFDVCEVKYNAIQDITVYNQDGKNIEDFGGSFKIVYPSEGVPTSKEEAKLVRINDKPYEVEDVKLDGEEIFAPESRRPFYIVVIRGDMKAEDFTGIHAKIDFQYLEHVDGTASEYKTRVREHWYSRQDGDLFKYKFTGSYCAGHDEWGNCIMKSSSKSEETVETYIYELHRKECSHKAQIMAAYSHDGWRHYKKYSIVISSEWEIEPPPNIQVQKLCKECGPLYGAEFDIELRFEGKDGQNETPVNKTLYFTRITDTKGLATVTAEEIEAEGVYIRTFSGYITAVFKETQPPAGHKLNDTEATMIIRLEKGAMQMCGGYGVEWIRDEETAIARITIYNEDGGIPIIQLAKVDSNAGLVKEAFFEVHVSYTDPEGVVYRDGKIVRYGDLIDKKYNIIRGRTKNGILNLTVEDFANMKYGFNIVGYTGKITLDIVEVRVDSGGYSVSPRSKDVTLTYHEGELVDYTEYTDAPVITHYIYDNPLAEIYDWAKGRISYSNLSKDVQRYVDRWLSRQQNKHPEMKYDDILAWLVSYLEEGQREGTLNLYDNIEEWKHSTMTTETKSTAKNGEIAQITIEDFPGKDIDIPDIPKTPEANPLFMTIAGTVFLDQTTTKGEIDESNGYLDKGETLLMGIEVTLYEENGTKATLIPADGEIRTNPTMTNFNGYYEFRGVDPMKKYYVEFKYNGMEYKTTQSENATYNGEAWAKTSKGSDLISSRAGVTNKYNTVTYDTKAYDYYELQGLYTEMAKETLQYIRDNNSYPADPYSLIGAHLEDKEIKDKIAYMKACEVKAYAGYNSIQSGIGSPSANGTYAHSSLGDRFVMDGASINTEGDSISFAGDTVKKLYPGQLQVHLGLIERDSTDLSLLTDIVKTNVSVNGYDTTYNYHQGLSSYHQYIFEEDYNYSKTPNTNGIAYYTEDNIDLYLTYEIAVRNDTKIATAPLQIVDYYNNRFTYQDGYTTSKGNHIAGLRINGNEVTGRITANGFNNAGVSSKPKDYNALFINLGQGYLLNSPDDELKIQITFKLTDRNGHATEVLKEMLLQEDRDNKYSRSWEIKNYAEINAYYTPEGYLDRDSHPGTFEITKFEERLAEYQKAYAKYVFSQSEDDKRAVKLALGRMTDLREDDAWKVSLILSNNGYVRELSGNVWEAINDEVKNSLHLQKGFGERLLTKSDKSELNLAGIKVELVEMLKNTQHNPDPDNSRDGATQLVRGQTVTDENGNYKFTAYLAGDYAVRFVYGDYEDTSKTIYSKVSKNTFKPESEADPLPINGQYYQSTKANPNTDSEPYWYKQRVYNETTKLPDEITGIPRYSDAYDDAYSRLSQMKSKIDKAENSTSTEYDYDGVLEVESTRHTDPMYAYTSTMELEVEYTRPATSGNASNVFYGYSISDIDFGITPRAYNDLGIDKYVANIKLYTVDGNKLIDTNFDENGKVILDSATQNIVKDELTSNTYLDNFIDIIYNTELLQGATLEITFKVVVSNDSLHDGDKYDTIKYISKDGKVVAVAYYDEAVETLTSYEGNGRGTPTIVYHNTSGDKDYSDTVLTKEHNARVNNTSDRLRKFSLITGYNVGNAEIITSRATNIVDYINTPFDVNHENFTKAGVNPYWEPTDPSKFVSSREKYKAENGQDLLSTYDHIVRATDNSPLYKVLKPGERTEDEIVLSGILGTSASGSSDFEFSNLIEITRMRNTAGKIVDIEGYDIKGKTDRETSEVRHLKNIDGEPPADETPKYTPTISTSKSPTIKINVADGLTVIQDVVGSNVGIVIIALVILAAGIVLIKRFVIPSHKE
ncbi:MAG: hypothetical protein HFJ52_08480 [Clostridia bacterium]|nr:hypothetical protein [Clostridia bacterium]